MRALSRIEKIEKQLTATRKKAIEFCFVNGRNQEEEQERQIEDWKAEWYRQHPGENVDLEVIIVRWGEEGDPVPSMPSEEAQEAELITRLKQRGVSDQEIEAALEGVKEVVRPAPLCEPTLTEFDKGVRNSHREIEGKEGVDDEQEEVPLLRRCDELVSIGRGRRR